METKTLVLSLAFVWILAGSGYYGLTYDTDSHNCMHSSIHTHDLLAEYGIESHYACAILTPNMGHVWIEIELGPFDIPFETISLGVPSPRYIGGGHYISPDCELITTDEVYELDAILKGVE